MDSGSVKSQTVSVVKKKKKSKARAAFALNLSSFNDLTWKQSQAQSHVRKLVAMVHKYIEQVPPGERKEASRQAPFHPSKFYNGTQVISIRLYTTIALLTSNGSSQINFVIPFDPANFLQWSSFQTIFDEYRPLRGRVHLVSSFIGGTTSEGILAVATDFDNSTAFSSYTVVSAFDTCHVYRLGGMDHYIDVQFDGMPDFEWVNTAATSAAAWVKAWGDGTTGITASATWGVYRAWFDVQFRQVY